MPASMIYAVGSGYTLDFNELPKFRLFSAIATNKNTSSAIEELYTSHLLPFYDFI